MSQMRTMEVQELLMAQRWVPGDEQRSLQVEGDGWILSVDAGEHGNLSVEVGDRSGSELRSVFVVNEDRSDVVPLVEVRGPLQVRLRVDGAVGRLVGKSSRSDSPTKVLETDPTMRLEGSGEVREFAGEANFAQVNGSLNCKGRHGPPGRLLSLDNRRRPAARTRTAPAAPATPAGSTGRTQRNPPASPGAHPQSTAARRTRRQHRAPRRLSMASGFCPVADSRAAARRASLSCQPSTTRHAFRKRLTTASVPCRPVRHSTRTTAGTTANHEPPLFGKPRLAADSLDRPASPVTAPE